jgi:hypothetical protein
MSWPTTSTALAYCALSVFLLAATWLVVGAANGSYLAQLPAGNGKGWIDGPLRGLAIEPGGIGPGGVSVTLIAMLGAYLAVLGLADRLSPRVAWTGIVLAVMLFCLTPLFFSSDAFGYLFYDRLGLLHGLNPYLTPPVSVPHDAVFPYVYWRSATTPYGPLFTLASYPLALLSPPAALWLLKGLTGAAAIALAWLVSRAASRRNLDPIRAALLVGLNPVLLFYAVSGSHNDLEATLLVAAAILLALGGLEGRAAASLVAAAAVKLTAGLALPFLVLGARHPRNALRGAAIAAGVAGAITLAVFGPHVLDQLYRISSDHRYNIAYSGPDRLAVLLGQGITPQIRLACLAVTGAVIVGALRWTWKGGDWIAAAGWATLALLAGIASFAPWYTVWLLPFAALARGSRLRAAALAFTAYVLAVHLPLLGGVPWLHGPTS